MGGKVMRLPSDALIEAREEGRSEGTDRVNQLNIYLKEAGRIDDIICAAEDKEYQQQLFQEFHI